MVDRDYVTSRIGQTAGAAGLRKLGELCTREEISSSTYLDQIVMNHKRLFLILDDIERTGHIFEAVDQGVDDDELPLSKREIASLAIPARMGLSVSGRFMKRQYLYTVKELAGGKHVDYGPNDVVPVTRYMFDSGMVPKKGYDKVRVNGEVYFRRTMQCGEGGVDKDTFVEHYRTLMNVQHPHVMHVWATYTQGDYAYVLEGPSSDTTLQHFLKSPPSYFTKLTKREQQETLVRWCHCLTDAVLYLHDRGFVHGRIRPSNIFIDKSCNIFLGEYDELDKLEEREEVFDVDTYQHGAPETWAWTQVALETTELKSAMILEPGGGRVKRRVKMPKVPVQSFTSPATEDASYTTDETPNSPAPESSSRQSSSSAAERSANSSAAGPVIRSSPYMPATTVEAFHKSLPISDSSTSVKESSRVVLKDSEASGSSRRPRLSRPPTYSSDNTAETPSSIIDVAKGKKTRAKIFETKSTMIGAYVDKSLPVPYPADVFSLGTILCHLTTAIFGLSSKYLDSLKYSSKDMLAYFGKYNVNAGRGGAPPDKSFHWNTARVHLWLTKLTTAAAQRDGPIYAMIPEITRACAGCVCRDWTRRNSTATTAKYLAREMERILPGVKGECCGAAKWGTGHVVGPYPPATRPAYGPSDEQLGHPLQRVKSDHPPRRIPPPPPSSPYEISERHQSTSTDEGEGKGKGRAVDIDSDNDIDSNIDNDVDNDNADDPTSLDADQIHDGFSGLGVSDLSAASDAVKAKPKPYREVRKARGEIYRHRLSVLDEGDEEYEEWEDWEE